MSEFAGLVLFAFVIGLAAGLAFGICYCFFICICQRINPQPPLASQENQV